MIKIDSNKQKTLSFKVSVQGIDPSLLEYNLRLSNDQIDYGFKGKNKNGEIEFSIPPLKTIVKEELLESINKIKLEVNDRNNKYYLKPFEDDIKLIEEMKIDASLTEDKNEEIDNIPSVDANLLLDNDKEIDNKIDKKETKKSEKVTKFKKFLGN